MSNKKTMKARILNAASKETSIRNTNLRRRLRIPGTEMDNVSFNNSILRTARFLMEDGLLKRVARGEYAITKRGMKAVNSL
jgi:hypothetical protein